MCDVHEELQTERKLGHNLIHAMKRTVSMMGRVALEHERVSADLRRMTLWIFILTIVLVIGEVHRWFAH